MIVPTLIDSGTRNVAGTTFLTNSINVNAGDILYLVISANKSATPTICRPPISVTGLGATWKIKTGGWQNAPIQSGLLTTSVWIAQIPANTSGVITISFTTAGSFPNYNLLTWGTIKFSDTDITDGANSSFGQCWLGGLVTSSSTTINHPMGPFANQDSYLIASFGFLRSFAGTQTCSPEAGWNELLDISIDGLDGLGGNYSNTLHIQGRSGITDNTVISTQSLGYNAYHCIQIEVIPNAATPQITGQILL